MYRQAGTGRQRTVSELLHRKIFWVFIVLIVCAGASEIVISQWASAFAESGLKVNETAGDLAGPCGFAVMMGISRMVYAKHGEKVSLTDFMLGSGIFCICCYLTVGLAKQPAFGLLDCALCGFSVGVMWP